jgi:uncharacterized protein
MLLDVSPLLNGEKSKIDFTFAYTPSFPYDFPDVTFGQDVEVSGTVQDMAGYMTLAIHAEIPYQTMCARCLTDVNGTFSVELNRDVAQKEQLQDEEEQERYALIENRKLDLENVISQELLLSFPSKFLCKEECRGLCVRCGKDLNLGPCECPSKEADPRLDVLRKLLEEKP